MGKQIFSDFLVKTNKTGNYFKVAEFNFREDLRKDVDEDAVVLLAFLFSTAVQCPSTHIELI